VACGSEVLVERCISFGCVVEFSNGRWVYIVVLTGPVGPILCYPASGTWLRVWILEEALTFALIYTLMITVCHTLSRCLLYLCVLCYLVFDGGPPSYIPPLYLTMHGPMNKKKKTVIHVISCPLLCGKLNRNKEETVL
jgi:hypothetical protein